MFRRATLHIDNAGHSYRLCLLIIAIIVVVAIVISTNCFCTYQGTVEVHDNYRSLIDEESTKCFDLDENQSDHNTNTPQTTNSPVDIIE